jgi:RNA polymerase sigma factor (sigma-70 family)
MNNKVQTDGELLALFLKDGDQAPFEELMRRHGKMVFGICCRTLGATHDAEDAAQAVFMTLAHKAHVQKNHQSVAAWLYRVACNVSSKIRRTQVRRINRELEVAAMIENRHTTDNDWILVSPLLDSELDALPEKYRLPVILHYIEGRSQVEIADQLGCTYGAISGRLNRAREMLRQRLSRRGVALSANAICSLITQHAPVTLPSSMSLATVKAAALIVAGNATAPGLISAQAAALTKATLKVMFIQQAKVAAIAVLSITLVAATAGVAAYKALASETQPEERATDTEPISLPRRPRSQSDAAANEIAILIRQLEMSETRSVAKVKLRAAGEVAREKLQQAATSDHAQVRSIASTLLKALKTRPIFERAHASQLRIASIAADVATRSNWPEFTTRGAGKLVSQREPFRLREDILITAAGRENPNILVMEGDAISAEWKRPEGYVTVEKSDRRFPYYGSSYRNASPFDIAYYQERFDFTDFSEDVLHGKPVYRLTGAACEAHVELQVKLAQELGGEDYAKNVKVILERIDACKLIIGKNEGLCYRSEMIDAKGVTMEEVAFSNVRLNALVDARRLVYAMAAVATVTDVAKLLKDMKSKSDAAAVENGDKKTDDF